MKKLLISILIVFVLVFMAGCGGGSNNGGNNGDNNGPVGATMTNEEANTRFDEAIIGMLYVTTITFYVPAPPGMGSSSLAAASIPIKAQAASSYTWNGPDSQGWYTTTTTTGSITFLYEIRYLASSNTIEYKSSYTYPAGRENINLCSISQVSTGVYSGEMKSQVVNSGTGTSIVEVIFSSVDSTAYGSGTFDVYIEQSGVTTLPRTHYAHCLVSYVSSHEPPMHVEGWYWDGDSQETITPEWRETPPFLP